MDTANAALERVEIPQDIVDRIAQLLTPGSSLIAYHDHGIGVGLAERGFIDANAALMGKLIGLALRGSRPGFLLHVVMGK